MNEFAGLIEVEDVEPAVPLAALAAAGALAVGPRRCLCGAVRLGDDVVHHEDGCRPIVRERAAEVPYPAPLATSRDPWDGEGTPSPVLKLAEKAREASWDVRVQRSRGCVPHAAHGTPGAVKWLYALVLGNGEASAYAVHDGAGWTSVMLWGRTRAWFPAASVTDLAEYVSARGALGDEWYDAIRERERVKAARKKALDACGRGTHPLAIAQNGMVFCPTCENAWPVGGQPWRKVKKGKSEAL